MKNKLLMGVAVSALLVLGGCMSSNSSSKVIRITDIAKNCKKPVTEELTLAAHALFDTNKAVLRPEGKRQLDELADKILNNKLIKIKRVSGLNVVGHTDSRGGKAYNQGLSERRAASVRNYLVGKGIPADIIFASGEGANNPVATNKTAAGRQQNRRVNITVSGSGK